MTILKRCLASLLAARTTAKWMMSRHSENCVDACARFGSENDRPDLQCTDTGVTDGSDFMMNEARTFVSEHEGAPIPTSQWVSGPFNYPSDYGNFFKRYFGEGHPGKYFQIDYDTGTDGFEAPYWCTTIQDSVEINYDWLPGIVNTSSASPGTRTQTCVVGVDGDGDGAISTCQASTTLGCRVCCCLEPGQDGTTACPVPVEWFGDDFRGATPWCEERIPTPAPTPAPTPVMCPPALATAEPATGNWALGEAGDSCDEVCSAAGETCHMCGTRRASQVAEATALAALSDISEAVGCRENTCVKTNETYHPSMDVSSCCFNGGEESLCSSSKASVRRLCCCGGFCSLDPETEEASCEDPCQVIGGKCDCTRETSASGSRDSQVASGSQATVPTLVPILGTALSVTLLAPRSARF